MNPMSSPFGESAGLMLPPPLPSTSQANTSRKRKAIESGADQEATTEASGKRQRREAATPAPTSTSNSRKRKASNDDDDHSESDDAVRSKKLKQDTASLASHIGASSKRKVVDIDDDDSSSDDDDDTPGSKRQKTDKKAGAGTQKRRRGNPWPQRRYPLGEISRKMGLIVDFLYAMSKQEIVQWFASDPSITNWERSNPNVKEAEVVCELASEMFHYHIHSQEFKEALAHAAIARSPRQHRGTVQVYRTRLDDLIQWAEYVSLGPEGIEDLIKRYRTSARLVRKYREDVRCWLLAGTGQDDFTMAADYLQLHYFGVILPDPDNSGLMSRTRKMSEWYVKHAASKLEFEEKVAKATEAQAEALVDPSGLELLEPLTQEEREEMYAAAKDIKSPQVVREQQEDEEEGEEDAVDQKVKPKAKARKVQSEEKSAFEKSIYAKINSWELAQLLQELHQKSQNPPNEQKVTWLLQCGKKPRLDELAREDPKVQQARKKQGKLDLEEARKAKNLGKNKRIIKASTATRDHWAKHIDRNMSFEAALALAEKREQDGTTLPDPPAETDPAEETVGTEATEEQVSMVQPTTRSAPPAEEEETSDEDEP